MYAPVFPVPFFARAKMSLNSDVKKFWQKIFPQLLSSPAREGNRDAGFLDWAGFLPTLLKNTLERSFNTTTFLL